MKYACKYKRKHNNSYYRDSNRKKINVINIFNKQYLNYYNSIIMFF